MVELGLDKPIKRSQRCANTPGPDHTQWRCAVPEFYQPAMFPLDKRCNSCNLRKDLDEFHRQPGGALGRRGRCKSCVRQYQESRKERDKMLNAAYYEKNKKRIKERQAARKDEIAARKRAHYEANREEILARQNQYDEEHKAEKAAYGKARRAQDLDAARRGDRTSYIARRDKILAQKREYAARNPDKVSEANRNKRAKRAGAVGTYTLEEVLLLYDSQGGLCAYCEVSLGDTYHVDHMQPLARGGRNDWTNLAVTCPFCNISKKDKLAEEFMDYRRLVIEYQW